MSGSVRARCRQLLDSPPQRYRFLSPSLALSFFRSRSLALSLSLSRSLGCTLAYTPLHHKLKIHYSSTTLSVRVQFPMTHTAFKARD